MIGSITTFLQINSKYHRHKITGYYVPMIITYLLSTVINCDPEPKIHVVQETTKVKSLLQSYNHIGFNDNHWEPSAQLITMRARAFFEKHKKMSFIGRNGIANYQVSLLELLFASHKLNTIYYQDSNILPHMNNLFSQCSIITVWLRNTN